MTPNISLQSPAPLSAELEGRLLWSSLGSPRDGCRFWMGFGLLSDHGLPFCVLQMLLAARILIDRRQAGEVPDRRVTVLLADHHARSAGEAASRVAWRVARRRRELAAIGSCLGLELEPLLASSMDDDPTFSDCLVVTRGLDEDRIANGAEPLQPYVLRAVADVLWFHRQRGVKVGWAANSSLDPYRGRNDEPRTDLIAACIEPTIAAFYTPHGVSLDSRRPRAVPYTEIARPDQRLMLTGSQAGSFDHRLHDPSVSHRRRAAVMKHLRLIVDCFEAAIGPLLGDDPVAKAETLQSMVAARC